MADSQSVPPLGNAFPPPPPPPSSPPPPMGPMMMMMPPMGPPPRRRSTFGRVLAVLLVVGLVGSVLINMALLSHIESGKAGSFTTQTIRDGESAQQIAVYEIAGMIDDSQANLFHAFVAQVKDDSKVKAVVLRVNSPGGGVSSSDQMHKDVELLKAYRKTVVVSMGGMAASGGYYLSAGADRIFAEPTTVTGSIGVISWYPILNGTLDKIGMKVVTIKAAKASQWKDAMSPFQEPNAETIAYIQGLLNTMQTRFQDVVYQGRKSVLSKEEVDALSIGKVWVGQEAVDNKLVDQIGYLEDAITGPGSAASLASLPKPRVVQYHRRRGLLETLAAESPGVKIDAKMIDQLQTPKIMMIWRAE